VEVPSLLLGAGKRVTIRAGTKYKIKKEGFSTKKQGRDTKDGNCPKKTELSWVGKKDRQEEECPKPVHHPVGGH